MLFMTEKKNHFKIRSKQKRVGKLYNPVALSLPVFWNSNKDGHDINAWNAAHAPNVFYSGCSWAGISSAAAQPDLSLSQLPTEWDVCAREFKYYRPSATPEKTGLAKQIKSPATKW